MLPANEIIAVVTGANRGIGFEISRQLARRRVRVCLTARDAYAGETAADELRQEGLPVFFQALDVTDDSTIEQLADVLEKQCGRLDILVNNAGIGARHDAPILEVTAEALLEAFHTNCFGALRVSQRLVPLLRRSTRGRIINISSGMGALTEMGSDLAAYRVSKTCLNAVTATLASELRASSIAVNAVCPGWVKTRMGGPNAPLSVEQGADTAVWLALDAPQDLSANFLRDRRVIPW